VPPGGLAGKNGLHSGGIPLDRLTYATGLRGTPLAQADDLDWPKRSRVVTWSISGGPQAQTGRDPCDVTRSRAVVTFKDTDFVTGFDNLASHANQD
jgi:hypothetical protein